ncbi:hypothetical protein [Escherichia coli]|uniref:hypothetical protein n=1 Tax=Escherichia coli TaxID=562 RepID=UPI0006978724|nr:hypothetical protein [Escherichia coli]EFC4873405.1 AraC family transcriptional regulator [Escherichia coli]EFN9261334.1 AraC family transcriptional regulator [Escherichia coli]MBC0234535.1 AraC family transcriptional regulator [Escherichia coli]SQK57181.1 type III secretion system transcriptional regulator [Escherichia coli]SQM11265.1 type III secretion system transcriptional regulator [Escherichia coli]
MNSEIVCPTEYLKTGEKKIITSPEIWYIPSSKCVKFCVQVSWKNGGRELNSISLQGKECVMLMHNVEINVPSGRLPLQKVRLEPLSKLLAFIDEAMNVPSQPVPSQPVPSQPVSQPHFTILTKDFVKLVDKKNSLGHFINNVALHSDDLKPVLALLRCTEGYNLVRFLYKKSSKDITLTLIELGKQYGLSYSHFRRLCKQALCGHVKTNICNWRMAKTILECIENKDDITTAALRNGYASSSHFSHEVKIKMGFSLRNLKKSLVQRISGCD